MILEALLEQKLVGQLSALDGLSSTQFIASRSPDKTEDADSVVAVAAGFRQHDSFSLSPVTLPVALTIVTRVESDADQAKHNAVVEAIADRLSRWHKDGGEMQEALTSEKCVANELKMDGGSDSVYDDSRRVWTDTINITIRGAERFPEPPFDPSANYAVFSDGRRVEGWENTWSSAEQFSQFCFEEAGEPPDSLVEAYVYQSFAGFQVFYGTPGLRRVVFGPQVATIEGGVFDGNGALTSVYFKGRTLEQVRQMADYPWGLDDTSVIQAEIPSPAMPTRQQVVFSDGLVVPVSDSVFRDVFFMSNLCTATGHDISSIVEADVFSQQLSYSLVSPFRSCTGLTKIFLAGSVEEIAANMFGNMPQLEDVFFAGKSLDQVRQMANYPWGISDTGVMRAELG